MEGPGDETSQKEDAMSTRQMYVRWAIGLLMTLSVLLSASPAKAYVPEDAETGVCTVAASASTPRRGAERGLRWGCLGGIQGSLEVRADGRADDRPVDARREGEHREERLVAFRALLCCLGWRKERDVAAMMEIWRTGRS